MTEEKMVYTEENTAGNMTCSREENMTCSQGENMTCFWSNRIANLVPMIDRKLPDEVGSHRAYSIVLTAYAGALDEAMFRAGVNLPLDQHLIKVLMANMLDAIMANMWSADGVWNETMTILGGVE